MDMKEEEIVEPDLSVVNVKPFGQFRLDEYEKFGYSQHNNVDEVAIVGFWKPDSESKRLKCYHFFHIPNPVKRKIRKNDSNNSILYEVLFEGQDNELFFFMQQKNNKNERLEEGFYFGELKLARGANVKNNRINFTSFRILAENSFIDIQTGHIPLTTQFGRYLKNFNKDFDKQTAARNPVLVKQGQ